MKMISQSDFFTHDTCSNKFICEKMINANQPRQYKCFFLSSRLKIFDSNEFVVVVVVFASPSIYPAIIYILS